MHTTHRRARGASRIEPGSQYVRLAVLVVLLVIAVTSAGCARLKPQAKSSPAERDAAMRQIAADYTRDENLAQAQAALAKLNLANPAQLLVSLAEQGIQDGSSDEEIAQLARLAEDLGTHSRQVAAHLTPKPIATSSPETPPTPELIAANEPTVTAAPTATTAPRPSPTVSAPSPSPSAAATQARVVARNAVNLRGGPGTVYPIIGQMKAGQEINIVGRNASGDWWQLAWDGQKQAWVAGTIVNVMGTIDTIAVTKEIPAPPPTSTPAPVPTAAPVAEQKPTAAPPASSGADYKIVEQRMLTIGENGGCRGKHNIFVQVLDKGGAPLNGISVQRITTGEVGVSGSKDCFWHIGATNEGCSTFDIYGNGDRVRIASDPAKGNVSSEESHGLSAQDADMSIDNLIAAGYCTEGRDNCVWRQNPGGNLPPQLCNGHYSWLVKFQRTW